MFARLVSAVTAAATLALAAPAARASHPPTFRCDVVAAQQDEVTGQTFQGVLAGAAVHPGSVSVRCYVTVNGTPVASTRPGVGSEVAATYEFVSFNADDTDVVQVCAEVTPLWRIKCAIAETLAVPSRDAYRVLDDARRTFTDGPLCAVLRLAATSFGPVVVTSEGDVYVDGESYYDCPPYEVRYDDHRPSIRVLRGHVTSVTATDARSPR